MKARSMLAGAAAALSLSAAAIGTLAPALPTDTMAGPLARMLDAYAPVWLGAALVLGLVCLALGARKAAVVLTLAAIAGGTLQTLAYRDVTRSPDPSLAPDLRVLFFNANADNAANGARIVQAAIETGADIAIFAEAEALMDHREALNNAYAFVSPCRGTAASC